MAMKVRYTTIDGEIVSENRGGTERDYLPDPLGSTVALLNSAQAKTDTISYWPYGEVKTRTGTTATPFQFVGTRGYYRDSSTKTYVRARYLDTQKGRWISQDPIGLRAGDANKYRYVYDRPTALIDTLGLGVWRCCSHAGPLLLHCFISTHSCGAIGFSFDASLTGGKCYHYDNLLQPLVDPQTGKQLIDPKTGLPIFRPGIGNPAYGTRCELISNDSGVDKAICDCMKKRCTDPPQFGPLYACFDFADDMIRCACFVGGQRSPKCRPTQFDPTSYSVNV
jgi:RHS repeat-associated protein